VQTSANISVRRGAFLLTGFSQLSGVSLLEEVLLLVGARWGVFSGFVPELPVVTAGVVGLQRVVDGAAAAISGLRAVADSGMRGCVFGILAVK
jgi:hypothetical protein